MMPAIPHMVLASSLLPGPTTAFSSTKSARNLWTRDPEHDQFAPARQTSSPPMPKDRIAIIGIGCRFPGGVNDAESFWELLIEGREAVSEVPPDRWNVERYYDPEPGVAGKSIAK